MLLSLAVLALGGCERVVAVDPEDAAPVLALSARFEPDSTLRLSVEQTTPLGTVVSADRVAARATLTDGRGLIRSFEADSFSYGGYTSDARLVPGESYTLSVDAAGLPRATAAFTVPRPADEFEATAGPADGNRGEFDVVVRFRDPSGEGDYYRLSVYSAQPDGRDGDVYYETLDPSIRDETFFEAIRVGAGGRAYYGATFSDALFDGDAHEVRIRVLPSLTGGGTGTPRPFTAELQVCTRAYVDGLRSAGTGTFNPFSELAAPPSNVVGGLGTVGVFVRQRRALGVR